MSSSKRPRSLHSNEHRQSTPVHVTGKLLSLREALDEDGFPSDAIEDTLRDLLPIFTRWVEPLQQDEAIRRLRQNQGLDIDMSSDISDITSSLKTMEEDAATTRKISQHIQTFPMYSIDSDADIKMKNLTVNILQTIWFTRMNLFSHMRILNLTCTETTSFNEETNKDGRDNIYWYDVRLQENQNATDKKERLISHLLFHFSVLGYRKVESDPDYVYLQKSIVHEDGSTYNTHTWIRHCSIKQAIYELCRKEEHSELWNITLSDREVTNAENYLKNCIDHEFPMVLFQRRKYSFRDGIYDGDADRFVKYDEGVMNVFPELETYGTFMFIDQPFFSTYQMDPRYISCPAFETIMTAQRWSEPCIQMMYIMIGRLMHNVGEKDNWQILPYLIGEAGTGKSTIIDTIQKLIPQPLIGVFGSGNEAQFGTQDWDKLALIVFPEVKPNEFKKSMPLGKLFSLIAGDSVCLAAKFKAPKYVSKFPTHMIAAGNETPEWGDSNGAFTRRTACFPFRVKLTYRNPDLPKLIDTELPKILRKSLLTYYDALIRFAGKDLWSMGNDGVPIMPEEIRLENQRMQKATTPMVDFLLDREYVEIDPDAEVTREDFIRVFDLFIRNVRHSLPLRWCEDLYSHAFQHHRITVESTIDGDMIKGVRLKKSG